MDQPTCSGHQGQRWDNTGKAMAQDIVYVHAFACMVGILVIVSDINYKEVQGFSLRFAVDSLKLLLHFE